MTERTCGNCRWYGGGDFSGQCRRRSPRPAVDDGAKEHQYYAEWPTVFEEELCGEWSDKSITPAQQERRELVRRFAVAIAGSGVSMGQAAWDMAEQLADAEPDLVAKSDS